MLKAEFHEINSLLNGNDMQSVTRDFIYFPSNSHIKLSAKSYTELLLCYLHKDTTENFRAVNNLHICSHGFFFFLLCWIRDSENKLPVYSDILSFKNLPNLVYLGFSQVETSFLLFARGWSNLSADQGVTVLSSVSFMCMEYTPEIFPILLNRRCSECLLCARYYVLELRLW